MTQNVGVLQLLLEESQRHPIDGLKNKEKKEKVSYHEVTVSWKMETKEISSCWLPVKTTY